MKFTFYDFIVKSLAVGPLTLNGARSLFGLQPIESGNILQRDFK